MRRWIEGRVFQKWSLSAKRKTLHPPKFNNNCQIYIPIFILHFDIYSIVFYRLKKNILIQLSNRTFKFNMSKFETYLILPSICSSSCVHKSTNNILLQQFSKYRTIIVLSLILHIDMFNKTSDLITITQSELCYSMPSIMVILNCLHFLSVYNKNI